MLGLENGRQGLFRSHPLTGLARLPTTHRHHQGGRRHPPTERPSHPASVVLDRLNAQFATMIFRLEQRAGDPVADGCSRIEVGPILADPLRD